MNTLIIPSITTHSREGSTWRDKIEELRVLPIDAIGLFVTGLNPDERIECYSRLCAVKSERPFTIPFVHAVSSMSQDEYEFLIANFSTESFNLHPTREFPLEFPLSDETRQRISIENSSSDCSLRSSDLIGFAGICLDLAHYESMRLKSPRQSADLLSLVMTRGVIANHLSAIQMRPEADSRGEYEYSTHYLNADSSLDYISSMPSWMFGKYCALELENSLKEQSDAIDRLTKNRSESFEQQAA